MQKTLKLSLLAVTAMMALSTGAPAVFAGDTNFALHAKGTRGPSSGGGGDSGGGETTVRQPTYYGWMSPGILDVWKNDLGNFEFLGQGVDITVVDDFTSGSRLRADLGDGRQRLRHGEWTLKQAGMIAPSANMIANDFHNGGAISLADGKFNVLNLSYGYTAPLDRELEKKIVTIAGENSAFIAKSAGNEYGLPVGQRAGGGSDFLSLGLISALSDTNCHIPRDCRRAF